MNDNLYFTKYNLTPAELHALVRLAASAIGRGTDSVFPDALDRYCSEHPELNPLVDRMLVKALMPYAPRPPEAA